MWFFNWWRFSLAHGLNPFITDWVWAPSGINLAWTTFVPLPAWISIPLQVTVGEPATYNIIMHRSRFRSRRFLRSCCAGA